jgi:hypothetical protein
MARRKVGVPLAVAGVVLVAALAYGTFFSGGSNVRVVDAGGGATPAASAAEAPYAVATLPGIGTAAQDPGGGGGGGGNHGTVGPPVIQGAQGAGSLPGTAGSGDVLYFSGVNSLDPNRSATTSGDNTFPTPGAAGGAVAAPVLGTSATGCATDAQSVDYYSIPVKIETVSFTGAPRVHLRITGAGPITVRLFQQTQDGGCQQITSGSSTISGGTTDVGLGSRGRFQFTKGATAAVVVSAPMGSHTLSTSSADPSFVTLPGLTGF